jgi:hypothetical protein
MHPWFVPVTILLNISSPSSSYHTRCCKNEPIRFMFSHSFTSLSNHRAHTFRNLKRSRIMLFAKPWEHPSPVATLSLVNILSARINSSVGCTVASGAISTGLPGKASSATFERRWENFSTQLWTALRDKTSHRKQETFLYWYPLHWVLLPTETHNRTLLFGIPFLKHGRHFDYWKQPVSMRVRVCYVDCHGAGLCYYLMIYIGNLLRPLQLFYFHLWPIYWLSLVYSTFPVINHTFHSSSDSISGYRSQDFCDFM